MSTTPANSIPNRTSSRRPVSISTDERKVENPRSPSQRNSSEQRESRVTSSTSPQPQDDYLRQPRTPTSPTSSFSGQIVGSKTRRSMDLAPHDPSPLVPRYSDQSYPQTRSRGTSLTKGPSAPSSPTRTRMNPSHSQTGSGQQRTNDYGMPTENRSSTTQNGYQNSSRDADMLPDHLRLPAGFQMGRGQSTDVETTFQPAVTHETIIRKKTEVIQQAIRRDVHVHHYHTVVQPIRVVEILPAKHYVLDEKTGQRIEIPEPEGWIMPDHLKPYTPDTSWIRGLSRHYLVNEEYPEGVLESPPLHHKDHVDDLRRSVHESA